MEKLRIAVIWNLTTPIPVATYGGIERIVYMLLDRLSAKGHELTLFARSDSAPPCKLVSFGAKRPNNYIDHLAAQATLAMKAAMHLRRFDVIHSFARSLYMTSFLPTCGLKVQSYGSPINPRTVNRLLRLSRGQLIFTSCSDQQAKGVRYLGRWETVYNAVDIRAVPSFRTDYRESYLAFLGRFHPIKGLHHAIAVAKKMGKKIKIGGDVFNEDDRSYFEQFIRPQVDGKDVEWIGPLRDHEKFPLLLGAEALLFPIEWDEPFGLVVVEAMACGTPVLAFGRGAIPEIISHGRDGFICSTEEEMAALVPKIASIDRAECRRTVEGRFSADRMADRYELVYRKYLS